MEDKEIEKLLKESAENIKIKDFSERWSDISASISSLQDTALKEPTIETVLATSANENVLNESVRKKIVYSLSAVFLIIVICLAIVLPITLKKDSVPMYLNLDDLDRNIVSENEFYSKLEDTDLTIIDIENFNVNNYALLYTAESKLVGGKLEIYDEVEGVYAYVVFYDKTVQSSLDIGDEYKKCEINGINIEYKTEPDEDIYTTIAKAVSNSISYELECLSLDENIENFFEKIFA